MTYDLRHLVHTIETTVAHHLLDRPGTYARWLSQPAGAHEGRDLGINPYGCADAANILYTIGRFPTQPAERQAWIDTLQGLQDPASGMFVEPTHHPIHTTAHCIAALELFDARPLYPLHDLAALRKTYELSAFLDRLDWRGNPWRESHRGAGLYAALVLAGEVNLEWEDRYFSWLWEEADPATGLWRQGKIEPLPGGEAYSIFPHLAGSFHYLFNHEYARRPLRYPAALVDTALAVFYEGDYPLGARVSFAEIDWVYCLTRALRQSGHRFVEARKALEAFTERYLAFLADLDPHIDDDFNDLHQLFGAACCLAELQQALPGQLRTNRPLKLVLDRRPFI